MIQVLNDPRFGNSLTQVDATVKKHEAISADIMAREERFHDLNAMSEELIKENYHGAQRVKKREEEVLQRWKDLLKLLESRKINLNNISTMFSMLREIETVMSTIQVIYVNVIILSILAYNKLSTKNTYVGNRSDLQI